jgi:lysophospholipase L1-like esterase
MFPLYRVFFLLFLTLGILQGKESVDYPHALEPDPDRFAHAIKGFEAADAANPPREGAIVCTGSSSMRMWHPRIKEDLPGLTLIPRGFGGSHYTDVIHYLDVLILKHKPRAVLLYEGDNDAAYGKSPERIFEDFKFLVARCREQLPKLRIYVIGAKPSIARWNLAEKMQAANAMIAGFCRANEGFTYIDVWPFLLADNGEPRLELLIEDKLHLNEAGYDAWANAIAPLLQQGEAGFE